MATLYWYGGTGSFQAGGTSHWSTNSGNTPSATHASPTSADDVIFDTLSNATAYTVTIDASSVCRSVTWGAPLAGKITIAGSAAMDCYGDWNFSGGTAGITRSYTGTVTFKATSGTKVITSNSVTWNSGITLDGVGGTFQLADDLNISAKTITLTNGTFDSNGKTVTANAFSSSNSNTRVVTLGASTLNLSATGTAWTMATSTNSTLNANTSQINVTGAGTTFSGGAKTYYNVTFSGGGQITLNQGNTFNNLTYTGVGSQDRLLLASTNTINGTLNITGITQGQPVFVASNNYGTTRTISAAAVSLTNVMFRAITASGTASPFTGTSIGNALGNTNITATSPVTRYWVGNGGTWSSTTHWSTSSGGSSGATVPLAQDTVIFDSNSISSGSQTIIHDGQTLGLTCTFATVTNNPTLQLPGAISSTLTSVFGNLTLGTGMTMTNGSNIYFWNNGSTATLTSNGVTITGFVLMDAQTANSQLLMADDSIFSAAGVQVNANTFDVQNHNITQVSFNASNANSRTVNMGTGTWEITGASTPWDTSNTSGLTLNPSTSTIKFSNATASAKNFSGGGLTFANFWFTGSGTGTLQISGSNTFKDFKVDTQPKTVLFVAGTTNTIQSLTATGTAGNLITLK